MSAPVTLGVDIGTSSSKGVLVDGAGRVIASVSVRHAVERPRPGWVEMEGLTWWAEFVELVHRLMEHPASTGREIAAVGVSGMGPCVLLTDARNRPVRPAILYGVDTRAAAQIDRLTDEIGEDEIVRVGGSRLSSQAAGPKISWIAEEEPQVYARARRLFMPASWLAHQLTGAYVLDHQSASQTTPLYDVEAEGWHDGMWARYAPGIEQPELRWSGETAGVVSPEASEQTGIPAGTPVITGTIDAWTEAVSVGGHGEGDLMLMYGTTLFLIATGPVALRTPSMWTTAGAFPGTRNLAGGLAASGALTDWVKDLTASDYARLLAEAQASGIGARGLLMLPYFSGERTPILDPDARGVVAGLTLDHGRGDLYRAALEATAFGVRHNVETMRAAGADIRRVVAVGGGTQARLWLQIVSDVTGLIQEIPTVTLGASYGAAFLAAGVVASESGRPPCIDAWNPTAQKIIPDPASRSAYDELYAMYLDLYPATRHITHALAARQRGSAPIRLETP
ncbi:FGGY family carbohydrate kinase [Microbacterium chocolatum]|uniref:FGGY-family carbohydrate kinase n=1 Tax=Microbacterium aurantiacum TaxID=162393 RepID=UPI00338E9CD5